MKSLKESLFDADLVTKDPLDDPGLEEFLGSPVILWYIFQYWDMMGEDEILSEYHKEEWSKYKPIIDYVIKEMDKINRDHPSWFMFTEWSDEHNDDDVYAGELYTAVANLQHMCHEKEKGTYVIRNKGDYIPNSQIRYFIEDYAAREWNLDWSGYILLTEGDSLMVFGFPKKINKKILKIFGID